MPSYQLTAAPAGSRRGLRALVVLPIVLVLILMAARTIASFVIEYRWWQEMNQVATWLDMMLYGFAPLAAATLLAFAVLFGAHERGMEFAAVNLRENPRYTSSVDELGKTVPTRACGEVSPNFARRQFT